MKPLAAMAARSRSTWSRRPYSFPTDPGETSRTWSRAPTASGSQRTGTSHGPLAAGADARASPGSFGGWFGIRVRRAHSRITYVPGRWRCSSRAKGDKNCGRLEGQRSSVSGCELVQAHPQNCEKKTRGAVRLTRPRRLVVDIAGRCRRLRRRRAQVTRPLQSKSVTARWRAGSQGAALRRTGCRPVSLRPSEATGRSGPRAARPRLDSPRRARGIACIPSARRPPRRSRCADRRGTS